MTFQYNSGVEEREKKSPLNKYINLNILVNGRGMTMRMSAGRKTYRREVCVADVRRENNQRRSEAQSEVLSTRWHKKRELYHRLGSKMNEDPTTEGI